jgi:hypothetical protein
MQSNASQDDVQAAAAPMAPVRTADRCNAAGVSRDRQPVVYGGADAAALHGRIASTRVTGDQQQHALAARDCLLERSVDCTPCRSKIMAMKIQGPVGLDRA